MLLLASSVAGCGPGQSGETVPEEQLTLAWQQANCPPTEALGELILPNGGVADVEVLEALGDRLYVPRQWLRDGNTYMGNFSQNGVKANTGGSGSLEPRRRASLGGSANPGCLGTVFRSIGGRSASRGAPFQLQLTFRRTTTSSADGTIIDRGKSVSHAYQNLTLVYRESGDLLIWDDPPRPADAPRVDIGHGWFTVPPLTPSPVGHRVAIDGRALGGSPLDEAEFKAHQVYDGWRFGIRLGERVGAVFDLTHVVPVSRWRDYRAPARELYEWLRTRPAHRDNDRQFSF